MEQFVEIRIGIKSKSLIIHLISIWGILCGDLTAWQGAIISQSCVVQVVKIDKSTRNVIEFTPSGFIGLCLEQHDVQMANSESEQDYPFKK